jgi:putative ABC transport system permease protein
MGWGITFRIAAAALAKNKMRAGLTILGVVIGIAAVTAMYSLGTSASKLVQGEFQNLGTNVIVVIPGSGESRGARTGQVPTLTAEDGVAIAEECPSVLAVSPIVGAGGQVVFGNNNVAPREMQGVGVDYLTVRNWPMRAGTFFSEREIVSAAKVVVLGQTVVEKLFQTANPIGESVRIRSIPFTVIGVLEAKGANMVGDDQDDIVLLPFTTARKRLQGSTFNNVDVLFASARATEQMQIAQSEIKGLLSERHRIAPGRRADFEVVDTTEIAAVFGIITGTLTMMLALIAGISLLVGGVGIMNIMLVSVTERTREIGIRMAVGARPRDILKQFLVESVLLSLVGGLIGLGLGTLASVGLTWLINQFSNGRDWPIVVSIPAALIALAFSAAVGVFFGFYPARRASKLDPIQALRYE